jgi:site-specific DNA-methyltransferase (adenine-specific)
MPCRTLSDRSRAAANFNFLPAAGAAVFAGSGIALYRGDVLELAPQLPAAEFDAVITDPPYSSGGTTAAERKADPVAKYCQSNNPLGRPSFEGDNRDQRSWTWWCTAWLGSCRRATRRGGYCLVFTDWRQLPALSDAIQAAGWTWRGVVPWDKGGGSRAPHKGYHRHQCEYVVWGTNGPCLKAVHDGPFDGCISYSVCAQRAAKDKHHITGKPTPVMERLLRCVPQGGLVLDPFAGSATTLVAALRTGRRAVGFELSDEHCHVAMRRLQEEAARVPAAA